jgi:hypothetical protein
MITEKTKWRILLGYKQSDFITSGHNSHGRHSSQRSTQGSEHTHTHSLSLSLEHMTPLGLGLSVK